MKTILSVCCLALVAVATLAAKTSEAQREEHKELSAPRGKKLTFSSCLGSVHLKIHSKESVILESTLKARGSSKDRAHSYLDQIEFEYESSGTNVMISVRWKGGMKPQGTNVSGSHVLSVPRDYGVDIETAGGSVFGKDVNNDAVIRTAGGSIKFRSIKGKLGAYTSGGSIHFKDIGGQATLQTSGGSIKVGKVGGSAVAKTSGGSINIEDVHGQLEAKTSGGSIFVGLTQQITGELALKTSGGSIHLTVPGNFKADLEAKTSGGVVRCTLPLEVHGKLKKSKISGKINGGGPKVTLKTSGGNIKVAKR